MNALKQLLLLSHFAMGLVFPALAQEAASDLNTDLVYQAQLSRVEDIADLLKKGADPNAKDENGVAVVNLVAARGDGEALPIVKVLVSHKADLNAPSPDGKTALMHAITQKDVALVHYLISNGADFYAIDSTGRNVKAYADWVGDEQISSLVKEALRLDQERFAEGRSEGRLNKRIQEFIFYNCALQYLTYYRDSKQDQLDLPTFNARVEKIRQGIKRGGSELETTFRMPHGDVENLGKKVREDIHQEMEDLISNRNRRKYGVGSDQDMEKRCTRIANKYKPKKAEKVEK